MKLLINGYKTIMKTKIRNQRFEVKAIVEDLDGMVITITGSMQDDQDSVVDRAIQKVKDEFRHMAAMAIGCNGDVS